MKKTDEKRKLLAASVLKTLLFWLLLAGSVFASIWWIHTFPLRPDRLYSVIPPEATVIIEHRNLAERWPGISHNPLIRELVEFTAAAHGYPLSGSFDGPETAWWIEKIAGRHAVLAYTPRLAGTLDDAWILSSWIGRFSHQMRWSLMWDRSGSVHAIQLGNGERGWMIKDPEAEEGSPVLSLALVDGVLVASWSKHPYAAQIFSGRKKWGADPAEILRDKIIRKQQDQPRHASWENAPDRGWVRSLSPLERHHPARPLRIAVTEIEADKITGRLEAEQVLEFDDHSIHLGHPEFLQPLENILGDRPAAIAALPFQTLNQNWLQPSGQRMLQTLGRLLTEATDPHAPCFVAVCRSPFDGRVLGFRTPGILVGLYLDTPESGRRITAGILDILNAELGLSLIPKNETTPSGTQIFVVEGVNTGPFLQLAPAERPAFTVSGNWLLLALNRSLIEQLPIHSDSDSRPRPIAAPWRKAAEGRSAPAWAWLDFESAHASIRQARAVHGLLLHVMRYSADRSVGEALGALEIFTDSARPLGQAIFAVDDTNPYPGIRFAMGRNLSQERIENLKDSPPTTRCKEGEAGARDRN